MLEATAEQTVPESKTTLTGAAQRRLLVLVLVLGDGLALAAAFVLAFVIRFHLGLDFFQTESASSELYLRRAAVLIPLAFGGWFLFALGRSVFEMFQDWRLGKELDELQAQSASRREQKRRENEARLENGCDHDFETDVFGFPPNVCGKCGLEKEKPPGSCDHIWRAGTGAIPNSTCEICGKVYNSAAAPDASA